MYNSNYERHKGSQMVPTIGAKESPAACAHQLFEDCAVRAPDATALIHRGQRISFGDLDRRANELAQRLISAGVGVETLVGLYAAASPEAIVGILGVLKAGGAFVPLDPAYPEERLDYILQDCRVELILVSCDSNSRFSGRPVSVLALDDASAQGASRPFGRCAVGPENAACVIYTSGSTGRPKGVVRVHRGIVSRLAWASLHADDVCCHNMSLSTGFSQERLFLPLMSGLPLVILPEETARNVEEMIETLEESCVTHLTLVPGSLEQLLSLGTRLSGRLPKLRTLAVGSAPVPSELVRRFASAFPNVKLVNAYGTTESGSAIRGLLTEESTPGTVGYPVPGVRAHVLDEEAQPVQPGATGELYISGPCLARGYLFQPELTAERFVANPFQDAAGDRMYRTGDRARIGAGGEIVLMGRLDRQVKVRGYRVELAEVEDVLREHEQVREAYVALQDYAPAARLVAYVALESGATPRVSELRTYLRGRLPDYMVPAVFIVMERLPRALNGKVDSSALPQPDQRRPDLDSPYRAPAYAAERILLEIWEELLGVEGIGIHDNFMDLGGDSIVAAQIALRVFDAFRAELPWTSVFEVPTVAQMAADVERLRENSAALPA